MNTRLKLSSCVSLLLLLLPVPAFARKPELVVQKGHAGSIDSVAFCPDVRLLAGSGADLMFDVGQWRAFSPAFPQEGAGAAQVKQTPDDEQDETRRLWDQGLMQRRPAARRPSPRRRYTYRRATPSPAERSAIPIKKPVKAGEQVLGITFWRLRPSVATDDKEVRLFSHEKGKSQPVEWTPERIEAETPLSAAEHVRLSIEAPSTGYLYVIDREKYADGTLGDSYLIFPTKRTRGGDNEVTAGRVIEIPAQEDDPSYFTVRPSRPDQVAELLTVIVTPQRLNLAIGRDPLQLSKEQVAEWERMWTAPVERIEQVGGSGKAWTKAEKEAGADEKRLLTQDEPLPQTIYRVITKSADSLLVTVPLLYRIGQ
jgi:hypothetical protein